MKQHRFILAVTILPGSLSNVPLAVITAIILLTAGGCTQPPLEKVLLAPSSPGNVSTSSNPERPVTEGKAGRLYAQRGQTVYIGIDQDAAGRAEAGDAATIQELVAADRLFEVPTGTRVTFFAAGLRSAWVLSRRRS